jgi:beta-glucanase (GH16 family)
MVKDTRRRTTQVVAGLIVVLLTGAAVAVGITVIGSGHHRPTPTPSQPTTPSPPNTQTSGPLGVPGHWKLVFDDEFDGNSLNRNVWNAHNGWSNQNAVTDKLGNVAVKDGHAVLRLASPHSGAEIGTRNFGLKIGEFAQARIDFAGSGTTIYNWPAFWTSGPSWPKGGENDVAEGFGALTVNYHSPKVTDDSGPIPGVYAGAFHVYGIYRGPNYTRVYWDGKIVRAYTTHDDGQPQTLLLTLGAANHLMTGAAGAMVVDYVRAWAPA